MNAAIREGADRPLTAHMAIHHPTSVIAQPVSSRRVQQLRDFAERIIAFETRENRSSRPQVPVAFPVSDKLRQHMASIMGTTGFHALLARALKLTEAEVPLLRAVQLRADGSLEGLDELEVQADPQELAKGRVILLAELLGLLVVFIGEILTLRLVREVWPQLSLNDLDFVEGDGNDIETTQ
jgi:hypothetical protein